MPVVSVLLQKFRHNEENLDNEIETIYTIAVSQGSGMRHNEENLDNEIETKVSDDGLYPLISSHNEENLDNEIETGSELASDCAFLGVTTRRISITRLKRERQPLDWFVNVVSHNEENLDNEIETPQHQVASRQRLWSQRGESR